MNDYDPNYLFQDIINGDELMLSMQPASIGAGKSNDDQYQDRLDEVAELYRKVLDSFDEDEISKPIPAKPDSAGMKALQDSGRMSDGQVSIIRSLLDALEEKGIGTRDLDPVEDADGEISVPSKNPVIVVKGEDCCENHPYEVLDQFILVNPAADHIFERLTTWSPPERNNAFAHQVINCITYEDLCELIDVDVDRGSDAGNFLVELLESYKTMMDQVIWNYPDSSGFPMPEEFHKLKKTYYDSTLASYSPEYLENLAFEFTGDEDVAGVDRITRQVFASLQKIFKRGAGRS